MTPEEKEFLTTILINHFHKTRSGIEEMLIESIGNKLELPEVVQEINLTIG